MILFQERFKEEVREYFERLESGLLLLEHEPENFQVIDEIFRIMHSMKGSGGMFGFDLLSDVTHDLESLFDIFRSKKMQVNSEVISFTLSSIDGLQHLLTQEPTEEHYLLAKKLKEEAVMLIKKLNPSPAEINSDENTNERVVGNRPLDANQITYFIAFKPNENIFENGTNPLYLIDELNALGECNTQMSFDQLPDLMQLDPGKCYTTWEIFIATTEDIETLQDVFIFVNDKATIEIEKVSTGNVIHVEAILADFLNTRINSETWTPLEPELAEDIFQEDEKTVVLTETKQSGETPKTAAFSNTTVDSIRVDSQKIDQYMNLVSELITAQSRLDMLSLKLHNSDLELITESIEKISRQLRDNAFDMSLIPLQSIAVRFKRLIHDLSKTLDKQVELATDGLDTELDKSIIEKLIEPLLHIIRNSLDHGIENKEERAAKSKNEVGTISIKASTVGSYVQIEISDDGRGLDAAKIRTKAIAKGIITEHDKLSEYEIFNLIFEPGFSTSELVTDVSGRGVGLDVVRRKVQEMRGSVEIESELNLFTKFILKLPLSLSIIDGLLTRVGDNYYVIPSSAVKKIFMVNQQMLKKDFRQVVELEGNQIPYMNMHEEFETELDLPENQYAVTVSYGNQSFGLVVDEVVREYQAVIKSLGKLLNSQDIFSGASILGNGQLALVIDTNKIIQKYS